MYFTMLLYNIIEQSSFMPQKVPTWALHVARIFTLAHGQHAKMLHWRLYTMHRDTADPLEVPTAPIAKSIGKNIAIIAEPWLSIGLYTHYTGAGNIWKRTGTSFKL